MAAAHDNWGEYEQLVLSELKRLADATDRAQIEITAIRIQMALLQKLGEKHNEYEIVITEHGKRITILEEYMNNEKGQSSKSKAFWATLISVIIAIGSITTSIILTIVDK